MSTTFLISSKSRPGNILDWSIDDVCSFINDLSLNDGDITASFRFNQVDGRTLFGITAKELKEIGITALGTRKRLILEVQKLIRQADVLTPLKVAELKQELEEAKSKLQDQTTTEKHTKWTFWSQATFNVVSAVTSVVALIMSAVVLKN